MRKSNYFTRFSVIFIFGTIGSYLWSLITKIFLDQPKGAISTESLLLDAYQSAISMIYCLPAILFIALYISYVDIMNISLNQLNTESNEKKPPPETFDFLMGRLWFYSLYIAIGFIGYTLIVGGFNIPTVSILGMIFLPPIYDTFGSKLQLEIQDSSNRTSMMLYIGYICIITSIVLIWWLVIAPMINK